MMFPLRLISRGEICMVALTVVVTTTTSSAALVNIANPLNVLAGETVTVSSTHVLSGTFGLASKVVDDLAADNFSDDGFMFGDTDVSQRMSISGFNSGFYTVRIFTVYDDANRRPGTLVVRSSTSLTTSLTAGDYETNLGTFAESGRVYLPYVPMVSAELRGYFDLEVSAPAGTRSLYIGDTGPSGQGNRVYEVQALIPEPSSGILLGLGLATMIASRRRK